MTRLVSLGVIIGLVAVFGLLSLRVLSGFLLPLLLAAMLVVVFGPLHRWLRERVRGPEWVSAAYPTWNPWTHPWPYVWLESAGRLSP